MRKDGAPKKREEKGGPFLFFYQVYTKVLKIYTIKKKLFVRFLSIRPKLVFIKSLPWAEAVAGFIVIIFSFC